MAQKKTKPIAVKPFEATPFVSKEKRQNHLTDERWDNQEFQDYIDNIKDDRDTHRGVNVVYCSASLNVDPKYILKPAMIAIRETIKNGMALATGAGTLSAMGTVQMLFLNAKSGASKECLATLKKYMKEHNYTDREIKAQVKEIKKWFRDIAPIAQKNYKQSMIAYNIGIGTKAYEEQVKAGAANYGILKITKDMNVRLGTFNAMAKYPLNAPIKDKLKVVHTVIEGGIGTLAEKYINNEVNRSDNKTLNNIQVTLATTDLYQGLINQHVKMYNEGFTNDKHLKNVALCETSNEYAMLMSKFSKTAKIPKSLTMVEKIATITNRAKQAKEKEALRKKKAVSRNTLAASKPRLSSMNKLLDQAHQKSGATFEAPTPMHIVRDQQKSA